MMLNTIQQSEAAQLAQRGFNHLEIADILRVPPLEILKTAYRKTIAVKRGDRAERVSIVGPHRRWEGIAALNEAGKTVTEIAAHLGRSRASIYYALRELGLKARAGKRGPAPQNDARAEKMASMYRQGLTLRQIGEHFDLTRERVRQIIARDGLSSADGGQSKISRAKKQDVEAGRNSRTMAKWGITYAEMKARRADGTLKAYETQRHNADGRGVEWSLTFAQWLGVWAESGKLALRGRGKGRYVMSRLKDEGGYRIGNVHIQLSTDNNSEGIRKAHKNKAANTGVWNILPGTSKPWQAACGRKKLGYFATEAEAVAARAAYMAEHHMTAPLRGRGYTVLRGRKSAYQVTIGGRYIGCFATPEAALAARAAALEAA